jgi:hypothetical protein
MKCQAYNMSLKTQSSEEVEALLASSMEIGCSMRCRLESGSLRLFITVQVCRTSGGSKFVLPHKLRLRCNLSDWFHLYSFACKISLSLPRFLLCVQLIEKYSSLLRILVSVHASLRL